MHGPAYRFLNEAADGHDLTVHLKLSTVAVLMDLIVGECKLKEMLLKELERQIKHQRRSEEVD